jgi:hypothetical protein
MQLRQTYYCRFVMKNSAAIKDYTRERWIWDYFIVSNAAHMAPDAGNDEIILLLGAREYIYLY